jgi:hypothetical protein
MFTYTAKKEGKSFSFVNRKMALSFIQRGYTVEVYKDGKKIYLMKPIDKSEEM